MATKKRAKRGAAVVSVERLSAAEAAAAIPIRYDSIYAKIDALKPGQGITVKVAEGRAKSLQNTILVSMRRRKVADVVTSVLDGRTVRVIRKRADAEVASAVEG